MPRNPGLTVGSEDLEELQDVGHFKNGPQDDLGRVHPQLRRVEDDGVLLAAHRRPALVGPGVCVVAPDDVDQHYLRVQGAQSQVQSHASKSSVIYPFQCASRCYWMKWQESVEQGTHKVPQRPAQQAADRDKFAKPGAGIDQAERVGCQPQQLLEQLHRHRVENVRTGTGRKPLSPSPARF